MPHDEAVDFSKSGLNLHSRGTRRKARRLLSDRVHAQMRKVETGSTSRWN
jgi:hypothetical protein